MHQIIPLGLCLLLYIYGLFSSFSPSLPPFLPFLLLSFFFLLLQDPSSFYQEILPDQIFDEFKELVLKVFLV